MLRSVQEAHDAIARVVDLQPLEEPASPSDRFFLVFLMSRLAWSEITASGFFRSGQAGGQTGRRAGHRSRIKQTVNKPDTSMICFVCLSLMWHGFDLVVVSIRDIDLSWWGSGISLSGHACDLVCL